MAFVLLVPSEVILQSEQAKHAFADEVTSETQGAGSGGAEQPAEGGGVQVVDPEPEPVVDPEPEPIVEPEPEPEPEADGICGIRVVDWETKELLASTSNPDLPPIVLSSKGEELRFDVVFEWDDWNDLPSDWRLKWTSSDESVLRVSNGGLGITAVGDGEAILTYYVDAEDNPNKTEVVLQVLVQVVNQSIEKYVTDIRIVGEDGNPLYDEDGKEVTSSLDRFTLMGDLATTYYQFHAVVDVYDPESTKAGNIERYSTTNGPISQQVPGLPDVQWYVGDPAMAVVDDGYYPGLWRPVVYGGPSTLTATINAARVGDPTPSATIGIMMKDPDGGMQDDEYHPQDSITVLAYYELYPPDDIRNEDDERFVIKKTISLAEMDSLGTVTQTYTAFGSGSYYTMTGNGAPLSAVLSAAGVNLDGVKTIAFGTADLIDRPVSYDYIFGTNRYYFPNIDMLNFNDAVQVYPILASVSNLSRNGDTMPNYDMTEATRFRLLFGSTTEGGTSQYQIKWIHTLYVTLAGGPAVEEGDGSGGGGGEGGGGTGTGGDAGGGTGSAAEGTQAGGTTSGIGPAEGGAATQSEEPSANVQQEATGGSEAQAGEAGGSVGEEAGTASDAGKVDVKPANQQFTVYQVMNSHDSDVDRVLVPDNPYKQFALPIGSTMFVFGGLQSLLWYRRETRALVPLPAETPVA